MLSVELLSVWLSGWGLIPAWCVAQVLLLARWQLWNNWSDFSSRVVYKKNFFFHSHFPLKNNSSVRGRGSCPCYGLNYLPVVNLESKLFFHCFENISHVSFVCPPLSVTHLPPAAEKKEEKRGRGEGRGENMWVTVMINVLWETKWERARERERERGQGTRASVMCDSEKGENCRTQGSNWSYVTENGRILSV